MIIRTFIAIVAVVAIPVAVVGAAEPPDSKSDYNTKKVCDVNVPTGSRLGGVRRCRTAAERAQAKAENRAVVDRIQSQKNFTEAMAGGPVGSLCKSIARGC